MYKSIAIIGLGLLGGSICKKMRAEFPGTVIAAYGRDPGKLMPALRDGVINTAGGLDRVSLAAVELAVVSTPVESSIGIIRDLLDRDDCGPGTTVIDVGSVKAGIVRAVEGNARADRFIGCHPMAGSEKMGYAHSRADLFEGSTVVITPHPRNGEADLGAVRNFWEKLGALTISMRPEDHDAIAAHTSHLPHLAACALVRVLDLFLRQGRTDADAGALIGRGFLDTTRLAAGSPDMWRDIAALNRDNITRALTGLIGELEGLRTAVEETRRGPGGIVEYLTAAKKIRDGLS